MEASYAARLRRLEAEFGKLKKLSSHMSLWGQHIACYPAIRGRKRRPLGAARIEVIAFTVHFYDVDVVGKSVQHRTGEAFGAEGFGLFLEGQVTDDESGAPLIALRDQLKQQLGTSFAERHKTQLVDD